ncbi:MAG: D-hexose-6-phosphate mutarotase, partial [Bacteroidota bacterium]|nr:D-hexose-6-phosphate mutarotase [Bacteroidota bacterium]
MDIKQLNRLYGIPGHIEFIEGKGSLIIAKVSNNQAEAVISLYGAHILSFQPKDQKNILWMSPQSLFE